MASTNTTPSTSQTDSGAALSASEVPLTLAEPAPRALSWLDQTGLWANLGVSLLGFTGAAVVLFPPGAPRMPLLAAVLATVVGTVLGTLAVALAAVPGARTGAPAMVLLRGLFGVKPSYVPTVLNIAQLVGWGTFELVTIAAAAHRVGPALPHWAYVVLAGIVTTGLALRPLGAVRVLRKYVTVAVVIVVIYLFVQLLRHPMPLASSGSWKGFWIAVDSTLAVAVSWVPVASDYARHSRTSKAAFGSAFVGYSLTQIACYVLGLLAILTATTVSSDVDVFGAFIAVPLGTLAFAILATREIDQSFCNVYSTAVSTQNLRPLWDRRVLALVIGTICTLFALAINIDNYASFLSLIGSVFVPMFGVLVVDYFCFSGRRWDLGEQAPARFSMLAPWLLGFVMYQLVYPGEVSWWASGWTHVAGWLHFGYESWMSASLLSFAVAAVATALTHGVLRVRRGRRGRAERRGSAATAS